MARQLDLAKRTIASRQFDDAIEILDHPQRNSVNPPGLTELLTEAQQELTAERLGNDAKVAAERAAVQPRASARPRADAVPVLAERERQKSETPLQAESEARRRAVETAEPTTPETVPVFYATDRARTSQTTETVTYGSDRSRGGLAYGCTFVSIPPGHRRGRLERPSILRLEFREDPDRHVVALSATEYTKAVFFDVVRKAITGPRDRSTFVFIHGFNVDFNEAVRRTAQLGFDLGLRHAPILYSWPSRACL